MVQYESLLLGGAMSEAQLQTRLDNLAKARAARAKNILGRPPKEKKKRVAKTLTEQEREDQYQKRLKNLEKARATRAKNLAEKKRMAGKGQYNQDYVDESQINYAGSPLDMYYLGGQKEMEHERQQRGEIGMGAKKRRGRKPIFEEIEEDSEEEDSECDVEMEGGRMRHGMGMRRGRGMEFMEHSMHTGMSMPTPAQFQRGGKLAKKGRKKMSVEDLEGGAMGSVDIPEAIKVLGVLASKFGLRLSK
jgi:hypothetical protein